MNPTWHCRVAHACGAAKALDEVFYYDLDIMCPVAGEYTLPATRLLALIILTLPLILVSIVIALRTEGFGGINDLQLVAEKAAQRGIHNEQLCRERRKDNRYTQRNKGKKSK